MRNLGGNFLRKCNGQCCQNLTYHCFLTALTGHINGIQTPNKKNTTMLQLQFLGPCFKEIPIGNQVPMCRIHFAKVLLSFQLGLKESQAESRVAANLWLAILTCWGLFTQKTKSWHYQKTQAIFIKSSTSKTGCHFWHLTPDLDKHSSIRKAVPHLTLRPCHLHRNGPWHLRGQSCCPGSFSFSRQPKLQLGSCRKGRNCFKRGNGKPCVVEIPRFLSI